MTLEYVIIETKITFDGKKISEEEPLVKSKSLALSKKLKDYVKNELGMEL